MLQGPYSLLAILKAQKLEQLPSIKFKYYGQQAREKERRAKSFYSWIEQQGFCMQELTEESGWVKLRNVCRSLR